MTKRITPQEVNFGQQQKLKAYLKECAAQTCHTIGGEDKYINDYTTYNVDVKGIDTRLNTDTKLKKEYEKYLEMYK